MASKEKEIGVAVAAIFGSLALIPAMIMAKALIFSIVWGWFMVPFLGAPAISLPVAVGVMCIAGFLTPTKQKDTDPWYAKTGITICAWLMSLLIAWIAHLFV